MSVNAKMKKICDNIRLRTGGTALLTLDDIAEEIMNIGEATDPSTQVYRTIGTTFPPIQVPADPDYAGYDIDLMNSTADNIYSYIDEVVAGKNTVTKEILGKDASGKYDIARYTYAKRDNIAWVKQNYSKMYAWKNGSAIKYTESVSPRIGESAFDTPYVTDGGGVGPNYTNLKDQCVIKTGQRYSLSGGGFQSESSTTAVVVPVPSGITSVTIRFKGVTRSTSRPNVYGGTSTETFTEDLGTTQNHEPDSNGVYTFEKTKSATTTYIVFHMTATSDFANMIVTVNEPIEDTTGGGVVQNYTNLKDQCAFNYGNRYSLSSKAFKADANTTSVIVPVPSGETSVVVRFKNATRSNDFPNIYGGTSTTVFTEDLGNTIGVEADGDGVYTFTKTKASTTTYILFHMLGVSASNFTDLIVTVNEPIEDVTVGGGGGGTPITAVSSANRSRTVDGVEYVRYADGDIEPTVIYTDIGDSRNSNASITEDGITYNRYPLGDLGANRQKLIPVFIYANEHGVIKDTTSSENHEGKMPALIAARMFRDFATDKQENSAIYKYIRENCMLIVIPVANPFGFNFNLTTDTNGYTGYYNANTVNINRNYDTPGYDVFEAANPGVADGAYAGSEIETQYIMNTMVESGAVVAMSLHGFANSNGNCAHQGQNPGNVDYNQEKLAKISSFLQANWGYSLIYYDGAPLLNTPEVTAKSPSYITQCGAYGGIVEIAFDDNRTSGLKQEANQHVCENAYAQVINLMAMWLSDYLDAKQSSLT